MRIIAGIHRSRKIHPPVGDEVTRPITDRVKKSLFDRLIALATMGGPVVDIFSGTGSLGLESLSREADHCTFIERDKGARKLLDMNLKDLKLQEQAIVLSVDALSPGWLAMLPKKPVRLVFCDPPYALVVDEASRLRVMALIESLPPVMEEDGVLMLRTPDEIEAPPAKGWDGPERFVYGSMALHFYRLSKK